MKAYVICANDSIEAVVLEDESTANKDLLVLKEIYWKRSRYRFESREEYDHLIYWHLHDVEVLNSDNYRKKTRITEHEMGS